MIAVKFSVRGRDLASAVADAQEQTAPLIQPPYRAVWSGEFEEMQDAEARLMLMVPLSLALILTLLYLAFRSVLDAWSCCRMWWPFRWAASGRCFDGHQFQHLRGGRFHLHLRRGGHGRLAARCPISTGCAPRGCPCEKPSWTARASASAR